MRLIKVVRQDHDHYIYLRLLFIFNKYPLNPLQMISEIKDYILILKFNNYGMNHTFSVPVVCLPQYEMDI